MGDRSQLPYTAASVMEMQRLANIVVINAQHSLTRDLKVDGWDLKARTIVVPRSAPSSGIPTSFPSLSSSARSVSCKRTVKLVVTLAFGRRRRVVVAGKLGKTDGLIPFSLGKRACAGESLARMELFILFTMVMRKFRSGVGAMERVCGRFRSECIIPG